MKSKEIGARLKSARRAVKMTQLDIATRLKMARSAVSMIENGSRELRPGELNAFADAYRVSPSALIDNGRAA